MSHVTARSRTRKRTVLQKSFWSIAFVFLSLPLLGADATTTAPADGAPLALVIPQVEAALNQYQQSLGSGPDALPPLSSAEFDFKTTTATTIGGTINLFIFKIGGSHENDVVNDVTYLYSPPPPPKLTTRGKKKPPTLTEALASTIQIAAKAVKDSGSVGKLKFSKLTVNIQYGVKWDGSIGVNVPIQFVTVGLSGDKNKNTVQSVKLVFGEEPKQAPKGAQ